MTEHLPIVGDSPWLALLATGWKLPFVVGLVSWGPRLCLVLWRDDLGGER